MQRTVVHHLSKRDFLAAYRDDLETLKADQPEMSETIDRIETQLAHASHSIYEE